MRKRRPLSCDFSARGILRVVALILIIMAMVLIPSSLGAHHHISPVIAAPHNVPAGIVQWVQVNIDNSAPISTPNPYQQMIKWPSSEFSPSEASNLDNIEWFYTNGAVIPSWMENNASSSDSQTVFWLKLNGIGSQTNEIIYAGFASTSTNLLNGNTVGEAPQLSGTYGQYDNGANVFSFYDNFAGTSLNTNKWQTLSTGTISVSNGVTLSCGNSQHVLLFTKNTLTYPLVLETYSTYTVTAGEPNFLRAGASLSASNSGTYLSSELQSSYEVSGTTTSQLIVVSASGAGTALGTAVSAGNPSIRGVQWQVTGQQYSLLNDAYTTDSGTDSSLTIANYYFLAGAMGTGGAGSGHLFIQWARARSPPPGEQMPLVTINSGGAYPYSLTLSNGQNFFDVTLPGRGSQTVGAPGQSLSVPGIDITYEASYDAPVYIWINNTLPSGMSISASTYLSGTRYTLSTSPLEIMYDSANPGGTQVGVWLWFSTDNTYGPKNVTIGIEVEVG